LLAEKWTSAPVQLPECIDSQKPGAEAIHRRQIASYCEGTGRWWLCRRDTGGGSGGCPAQRIAQVRRHTQALGVEHSFAWLEKCRRLWKNCERKLNTSLQFVILAFLRLLPKRWRTGSQFIEMRLIIRLHCCAAGGRGSVVRPLRHAPLALP
jgi:hypothetical protein